MGIGRRRKGRKEGRTGGSRIFEHFLGLFKANDPVRTSCLHTEGFHRMGTGIQERGPQGRIFSPNPVGPPCNCPLTRASGRRGARDQPLFSSVTT